MGILAWLIIGGLAGWVASKIMGTDREQGLIGNIVTGVIGAFIGGAVVRMLGGSGQMTGINPVSFVTALIGAVIFIWILKLIRGRK